MGLRFGAKQVFLGCCLIEGLLIAQAKISFDFDVSDLNLRLVMYAEDKNIYAVDNFDIQTEQQALALTHFIRQKFLVSPQIVAEDLPDDILAELGWLRLQVEAYFAEQPEPVWEIILNCGNLSFGLLRPSKLGKIQKFANVVKPSGKKEVEDLALRKDFSLEDLVEAIVHTLHPIDKTKQILEVDLSLHPKACLVQPLKLETFFRQPPSLINQKMYEFLMNFYLQDRHLQTLWQQELSALPIVRYLDCINITLDGSMKNKEYYSVYFCPQINDFKVVQRFYLDNSNQTLCLACKVLSLTQITQIGKEVNCRMEYLFTKFGRENMGLSVKKIGPYFRSFIPSA